MGLFSRKPPQRPDDPYALFDQANHFRPRIARADFFSRSGMDFGKLLLLGILAEMGDDELPMMRRLSPGQKTLYLWWNLDAQVRNGGFVQYLFNGYGRHLPALLRGLEDIEATATAAVVKRATKVQGKAQKVLDQQPTLFDTSLYDRFPELTSLDDKYLADKGEAMVRIERLARARPNEFCMDENGAPIAPDFSGHVVAHDENGRPRLEIDVTSGRLHGAVRTFHPNGSLHRVRVFANGIETGSGEERSESGELVSRTTFEDGRAIKRVETFHANGTLASVLRRRVSDGQQIGVEQSWFDNGQLAEEMTWKDSHERIGPHRKFWPSGQPRLEAEFVDDDYRVVACWAEDGTQLLANGTGLYVNEFELNGTIHRTEQEMKRGRRHGLSRSFRNGHLTLEQMFRDGKEHGPTRSYYENGRVSEETIYRDGDKVSETKFNKFDHPIVRTTIIIRPAPDDATPGFVAAQLLNNDELARDTRCPVAPLLEVPQDWTRGCTHQVELDARGAVTSVESRIGDIGPYEELAERNIERMRFAAATRDGVAVPSVVRVEHEFQLVDGSN